MQLLTVGISVLPGSLPPTAFGARYGVECLAVSFAFSISAMDMLLLFIPSGLKMRSGTSFSQGIFSAAATASPAPGAPAAGGVPGAGGAPGAGGSGGQGGTPFSSGPR